MTCARQPTSILPPIPHLWAEAKRLFQRVIDFAGTPQSIERGKHLTRTRRKEIFAWFTPVAAMVRRIIVARAVIHLLMTPEGRKLLQESSRAQPAPAPKPAKSRLIPHPGWHTIWQPPSKTLLPEPAVELEPAGRGDPSSWPCPYRLAKISSGREDQPAPAPLKPVAVPARRPLAVLDSPRQNAPPSPPAPQRTSGSSAWRCARQIETIRRVLEDPQPAILRMARLLARHSPDDVVLPYWDPGPHSLYRWRQGDLYADQAHAHARAALNTLHRYMRWLDRPRDDPG